MKTLKTLLSVFAVAAVFSAGAYAQETADVAVTATVQATLTLNTTDVALGSIQQASSTIVANSNDVDSDNIGVNASAGSIQIQGTSGVDVQVSWTNAILSNGTLAENATFTPSVYLGSSEVSSEDLVTLAGGDITLDIGGTLAAPSGIGSYTTASGDGNQPITFTVQYN